MALYSSGANSSLGNKPAVEGSAAVTVKQEAPDEAEIRELAAKMVEANKTKLAATATSRNSHTNNHVIQSGQINIQNFMTKQTASLNKDAAKKHADLPEKEPPIDEDSARGRFGWETFGKCYVPYIFRRDVKYVAVRMVEMKLLNKFLAHVHPDLYSCTCIRSYFITDAEARLLNEINIRHSEGQFGKESFTSKDSVVLLQDAIEFYTFLEVTHNKLLLHKNDPKDKCGFIRINGEAVVPFTVRDGEKYVPLFYFEGETDNLKLKAKQLEGWDLSYLKFCCKVQGIRNELFSSDTCSVISLNDIKSYFPASTQFQDYWPVKVINPLLLDNVSSGAQQGAWTKQHGVAPTPVIKSTNSSAPSSHQVSKSLLSSDSQMKMSMTNSHLPAPSVHQPQIPTPTTVHSSARMNACQVPTSNTAAINGWSGLVGGQPTYQSAPQSMRMGSTAIPGLNPATTAANRQFQTVRSRPGHSYYAQVPMTGTATLPPSTSVLSSSVVSHPPPLIRGTVATSNIVSPHRSQQHAQMQSQHHNTQRLQPQTHQLQHPSQAHQMQRQQVAQQQVTQQQQVNHHHQQQQQQVTMQRQMQQQQLQQPVVHQQVHRQQDMQSRIQQQQQQQQQNNQSVASVRSAPASVHSGGGSNGDLSRQDPSSYKLIPIGETQAAGQHMPYKVSKAYVEGQLVPCINAKPYIYSELLMTLPDLTSHFFSSVSWHTLRQVLQDVLGVSLFRGNRLHMQVLRTSGKCQSTSDILPLVQVRDVMQYMPQLKYMFGRMNNDESLSKRQRTS